jgi:hypothetical protein
LQRGDEFARGLEKGREAALKFWHAIENEGKFQAAFEPELDILCFVPRGESLSEISAKSRRIFESVASEGLHLAVAELPAKLWKRLVGQSDGATVTCLRSVLMKPEHFDWVEEIAARLERAAAS